MANRVERNGVVSALENNTQSSVETIECSAPDDVSQTSPFRTAFRGFIPQPHVRLERYDITPYLDKYKKPEIKNKTQKKRGKNDIHEKRLSQNCSVKIVRDDLEKLKAAFLRSRQPSADVSSDSEGDNSSEMAVKCKICDKSYNSAKKLQKHQQNKHIIYKTPNKIPKRVSFSEHVIVHEVKEYHKCRKCPKIFEDYKCLKRHTRRWHKKRKCYECYYCNKKFVDRMFFKVHIRLHCEVCGKLFGNRSKYLQHRRDKCAFKLHKCKTCNESFFKVMALKDHMYDHMDPSFICDFCKESFQTKCAIAHHISFLHSGKKRPKELYTMRKIGMERLYLCAFCDESSVERHVIELHVQSLPDLSNRATTGHKDYYFCDQCSETLDIEEAMTQHRWSHYLNTNDNSRLQQNNVKPKTINVNNVPQSFKPYIVLEKLDEISTSQYLEISEPAQPSTDEDINNMTLKKAIVDPKSKKTILSKHQCETCGKYYSNNYCLNRHISTQHEDFEKLRCNVCEESFVWPSLLKSHKCIRLNLPEMPFDDARAEILFDNVNAQNGFDDLNISENDDYMNVVDFEIPAPIVEFRECDSTFSPNVHEYTMPDKNGVSSGYKLVMQEVPIEF